MGWTFGYSSKDDTIRNILADGKFVDHTLAGNEFWSVMEATDGEKVVVLFLLSKEQGSWGYKVMDESQGPYYVKCPLRYLDMTTAPVGLTDYDWRGKVRAYHRAQSVKRAARRTEKKQVYADLGLHQVKDALGGTYYE